MEDWDEEVFEAPGGEDEGVDFTGLLETAGDIEEELVGEAEKGHWEGLVQGWTWSGGDVVAHTGMLYRQGFESHRASLGLGLQAEDLGSWSPQLGEDSAGGDGDDDGDDGDDGDNGNDGHLDDLESLCGVNSS